MSKQNGRKGAPGLRQQLCEDTRVRRALFINRKLVAWVQVGRTNRDGDGVGTRCSSGGPVSLPRLIPAAHCFLHGKSPQHTQNLPLLLITDQIVF